MAGTISSIPECKSRHGKHENFDVYLNSPKFSEIFLESFHSCFQESCTVILTKRKVYKNVDEIRGKV